MNLNDIVKQYKCDYSENLPSQHDIKLAEENININFGNQLMNYLSNYGYLGCGSIELFGLNSRQGLNSDLFEKTKYLNHYFDVTKGYIALENINDSIYALLDSNDNVYSFNAQDSSIKALNIKLNDYIIKRFEGEKNGRKI